MLDCRLLSTLSPKNSVPSIDRCLKKVCLLSTLSPKNTFPSGRGGDRSWPAVHTIPQKPFRSVRMTGEMTSLLSTLSPKNCVVVGCDAHNCVACCPHYPPKTNPALTNAGRRGLACCPHYPPKTGLHRSFSLHLTSPAVHTIPQKPVPAFPTHPTKKRLLSTLSPKNSHLSGKEQVTNFRLLSTLSPKNVHLTESLKCHILACCPHYPPKTQKVEVGLEKLAVSLLSTLSPKNPDKF